MLQIYAESGKFLRRAEPGDYLNRRFKISFILATTIVSDMNRRKFVKASIITGGLSPMASISSAAGLDFQRSGQQYYELRTYLVKSAEQEKVVSDYVQKAFIPACTRAGIKQVGFFKEMNATEQPRLFLMVVAESADALIGLPGKLYNDKLYLKDGEVYLSKPATDPAYARIESSFLRAFTGMPKLVAPPSKPRIFELRRYESHSETAGAKKIKMFNELGEIDIFKRVGLTPVFFGGTLFGGMRPNLTYMITFDDMAEHDANWKVFVNDPEWKKVSSVPEYKDALIVSKITRTFLEPLPFSQI